MTCQQRISDASAFAFNSALNLFTVPPTNVTVARAFYAELLPLAALDQTAPIQFRLFNDNLWSDVSRIYLQLELCIQKRDIDQQWIPLSAADDRQVCPIQYIGQTIIQQLKVQVGNTDIYDSGANLYPFRCYLTNELSFAENVKRSLLATTGYRYGLAHDSAADAGFQERCKLFEGGRTVQLLSRLDFDLGNQELYLLNNIDALFTIYRAADKFCLQTLDPADRNVYRLALQSAKLYVKMIDVQPSLNLAIYRQLEQTSAKYAVRRTELRSTYISAGRRELDYNVFSSAIPRRLTLAMVSSQAFNGDFKLSPFNFCPYGVRELSVHAGGQIYPPVPYDWSFSEGRYARAFIDMYDALGQTGSAADQCYGISWSQFSAGWCIFVIPLTSTLDDSVGFELLRNGTTSIHMKFTDPIPVGGVELIVMGEFDQVLIIDAARRVLSDSNIS